MAALLPSYKKLIKGSPARGGRGGAGGEEGDGGGEGGNGGAGGGFGSMWKWKTSRSSQQGREEPASQSGGTLLATNQ